MCTVVCREGKGEAFCFLSQLSAQKEKRPIYNSGCFLNNKKVNKVKISLIKCTKRSINTVYGQSGIEDKLYRKSVDPCLWYWVFAVKIMLNFSV